VEDLPKKIVIVGGPRQVGKTTVAMQFLEGSSPDHPAYFNWDVVGRRNDLVSGIIPADETLIVLDEIHKYRLWRNLIKGFYDQYKGRKQFLVTGSARLDFYSRGGDSLQGRYFYYRLHPFSLGELDAEAKRSSLETLLRYGGFPEPLFAADDRTCRRWQAERIRLVLKDDITSLENVKDIELVGLLAETLTKKIASPLSIANLKNDLQVSHETVDRWVRILENLYFCFRLAPFNIPKLRALKKERKLYLWDWSLCSDDAARFENLVASHLLKYCHFLEDTEGYKMDLRYIKDTAGREIDFVVLQDNKPQFAVECKLGERNLSSNISYFSSRTGIPMFYQVHCSDADYEAPSCRARVMPFTKFIVEKAIP
jgi:uncharacterized protein